MKKNIFIILLAIVMVSCSVEQPKEQEVKQVVKAWYDQKSQGDGSGAWDVSGVTVLSVQRDPKNDKQFITKSFATGTFHAPPLATPKPDAAFADTVYMKLEWNGMKWITVE